MLIHSILCIWCQTFTCLNFAFTVLLCIASWKYVNPSQVSEDSVDMSVCLTIDVKIECGKFTVITVNRRIAFFNNCLLLIAYDLHKEHYCNSGNNFSGTVTVHLCLPSIDSITIRDSEKSASQNKLNNLNKLSAKFFPHSF